MMTVFNVIDEHVYVTILANEAHALKVYAHRTAVLEGILGMNVMLAAPPISLPEIRTIPHVQPLAFVSLHT